MLSFEYDLGSRLIDLNGTDGSGHPSEIARECVRKCFPTYAGAPAGGWEEVGRLGRKTVVWAALMFPTSPLGRGRLGRGWERETSIKRALSQPSQPSQLSQPKSISNKGRHVPVFLLVSPPLYIDLPQTLGKLGRLGTLSPSSLMREPKVSGGRRLLAHSRPPPLCLVQPRVRRSFAPALESSDGRPLRYLPILWVVHLASDLISHTAVVLDVDVNRKQLRYATLKVRQSRKAEQAARIAGPSFDCFDLQFLQSHAKSRL